MFEASCGKCDAEYQSKVKKGAQYMLRRHWADVHGFVAGDAVQAKKDRLEVARKYKDSYRSGSIAPAVDGLFMLVVCPREREKKGKFYSNTRRHFIERGVRRANVRRLFSYSLGADLPRGWTEADAIKHLFL